MWPLLLCSIIMVAVIIERTIVFLQAVPGGSLPAEIREAFSSGKTAELEERLRTGKKRLLPFIEKCASLLSAGREQVIRDLSREGDRLLKKLGRFLHLLDLIARITPLMGLLGTVLGIVHVFYKLGGGKRMIDPSALASGIWEALITTVAGLAVALPALIAHHFFEKQIEDTAEKLNELSEDLFSEEGGSGGA